MVFSLIPQLSHVPKYFSKRFQYLRNGASVVEYGIILALIGLVCLVLVTNFGTKIAGVYCNEVLNLQRSGTTDSSVAASCRSKISPTWNVATALPPGLAGVDYSANVPAATAPDGLPIVYSLISITQGASFDPASLLVSSSMPAAGNYVLIGQAGDAGGTVQQTFTFTIDNVPTGPYGAICAPENGTCTMISGIHTVTYYCAGTPNLSVSKTGVSGSIGCNNTVFGDPANGCAKTCAYH